MDIKLDDGSEANVAGYMEDRRVDREQALTQLIYLGTLVHKVHMFGHPTRLVSAATSFLVEPFPQGSL